MQGHGHVVEVRATWRRFLVICFWTAVVVSAAAALFAVDRQTLAVVALCVVAVGWWTGARYALPGRLCLTIDGSGITDLGSMLAVGFVSWSEVRGTSLVTAGRRTVLLVHLDDPPLTGSRRGPFARWMARLDRSMAETDMWLALSDYVSLDELAALIEGGIDRPPDGP